MNQRTIIFSTVLYTFQETFQETLKYTKWKKGSYNSRNRTSIKNKI